jgi:predicted peroxiredoxin
MQKDAMSSFLVHIVTGPEHPTRAALGFLVAKTALDAGHEVNMFLAGDAVQLVRAAVIDNLEGLGTGRLRTHYDALIAAGVPIYLSRKSSDSRGFDAAAAQDQLIEMAMPEELVRMAAEADTVLTY